MFRADSGDAEAEEEGQVGVVPDAEAAGLAGRVDVALACAAGGIEIEPTEEEDEGHAGEGRGRGGQRPVLLRADAAHHFGDELAEQDDGEQAVAFGEVFGVRGDAPAVTFGEPGGGEVDGESKGPEPVAEGRGGEGGSDPDGRGEAEAEGEAGGEGTGFGDAAGAQVLEDEDEAHAGIGGAEAGRGAAVEGFAGIGGHDGGDEALHEGEELLQEIAGVEARGEEGVAAPGPPDENEQEAVAEDAGEGEAGAERFADFGDGGHEDEVEEELVPGGAPRGVWTGRPETRGLNQPAEIRKAHEAIAGRRGRRGFP